jgi:hypothetical protein
LIGIFAAGFLAFFLFSYDRNFQASTVISVAVAHVTWGFVHHYIHKNLSIQIFIEYLTVAALVAAVILSVMFQG